MVKSLTYRFTRKDYLEMYRDLVQAESDGHLSRALKILKDKCEEKLVGRKR